MNKHTATSAARKAAAGLAVILATGCIPAPVFASTETETKIGSISLTFDDWERPEAGDTIEDTLACSSDTEGFDIVDAYYTEDDDEWERGDQITIKVSMEAKDGYYFSSPKLSKVTGLKGVDSKSVKKDGDKYTALATIKIKKKVGGDLEAPEDLEWNDTVAEWDDVDGADYYSVKLYRDSSRVTTISTNDESFDFWEWMTKKGDYTFEVKAKADDSSSDDSEWSGESDELSISSSEVYTGDAPTTTNYRGISTTSSSSSRNYSAPYSTGGPGTSSRTSSPSYSNGWRQDANGWMFYNGGSQVIYSWVRDGSYWYYIGTDGYMKTGWQQVNGLWYYMDNETTKENRPLGSMHTGWLNLSGVYYYLNSDGSMVTGYQTIGGNEYYFTESGAVLMNGTAPNGKVAGADAILK